MLLNPGAPCRTVLFIFPDPGYNILYDVISFAGVFLLLPYWRLLIP